MSTKNLEAGDVFFASFKGMPYKATVVADARGKLAVRIEGTLPDGTQPSETYNGLSRAGKAITGYAVTAGSFWKNEPQAAKDTRRGATNGSRPAQASTWGKSVRNIKPTRIQSEGLPAGFTQWFCTACMSGFVAPTRPEPDVCPQGHESRWHDDLAPVGIGKAGDDDE